MCGGVWLNEQQEVGEVVVVGSSMVVVVVV